MATFYLVSQWLAQYGQFVAGMSYTMSIKLLSIYTVGSLLCVFITAPLIRNTVRPTTLLMLYTFILIYRPAHRLPASHILCGDNIAFVIGFTPQAVLYQIGLTLMAERFPTLKEKQRGSITVRQHCNIYHSVDYGSSFAKKYCRYYVVRYRHRCYRLYTGTVYWLTQSQRNAASHAKGKYRSGW